MRGADGYNESLFTTVRLAEFVPASHPLRPIRTWVNDALAGMNAKLSAMYEADLKGGRPSIAPEKLMRAMLLQFVYSVRSERQLVEQISYNLLFRWFVGLAVNVRASQSNERPSGIPPALAAMGQTRPWRHEKTRHETRSINWRGTVPVRGRFFSGLIAAEHQPAI